MMPSFPQQRHDRVELRADRGDDQRRPDGVLQAPVVGEQIAQGVHGALVDAAGMLRRVRGAVAGGGHVGDQSSQVSVGG